MKIEINSVEELTKLVALITSGPNTLLEKIMATQQELATQVRDLGKQVEKIGGESSKSLEMLASLQDIIKNGPPVTPELQAAVDGLAAQLKVVDDLVPDAPPAPVVPPTP